MKLYKLLLLVTLTALLISCGSDKKNYGKYVPKLNPHPQYYMTVKGRIDPKIKDKVKLSWDALYETNNRDCDIVINNFEGVVRPKNKTSVIKAEINEAGYYYYKIPIDKYMQGYCKWKLTSLRYRFTYNGDQYYPPTWVYFIAPRYPAIRKTAEVSYNCSTKDCSISQYKFFAPGTQSIMPDKNYIYFLNFKMNK